MNCARCGETITVPYLFEGKAFGHSCINIVCPGTKKKSTKLKDKWVKATRFLLTESEGEDPLVEAWYQGTHFCEVRFCDRLSKFLEARIFIQDDAAYINVLAYRNGRDFVKKELAK